MAAIALYRKWRPMKFDEVVGQEHVTSTLLNALRAGRVAHAYLFAGPRGTGKTTVARLVAKAVNCLHPDLTQRPDNTCAHCLAVNDSRFLDLIEIDAASNTSVDDVRDLREKINFSPNQGQFKVYIVDEIHMLSTAAFNALLKTLEEPPAHAIFVLATTDVHKVPATVTSRCQRFEFRRLSVKEIVERLNEIAAAEKVQVEPAALEVVARQATGSMRDAVSLLDQLIASPDEGVTLARAQAVLGMAGGQAIQDLVDALAASDAGRGLSLINAAVDSGADPRQLARQTVDYLRGLLLVCMGNAPMVDATDDMRTVMACQAKQFDVPGLLRALRAFSTAAADSRGGWQPQLPLELALVECTLPLEATQSRIDVSDDPAPVSQPPRPAPPAPAPRNPPLAPAPTNANPPTSAATPPAASPAASLTFDDLREQWAQVLATAKRHHRALDALLRSGKLVGIEGSTIIVAISGVPREKLERPDNRTKVEAVFAEVFGRPCHLKCVSQIKGGAMADDIPADGLVASAVRELGAQVKRH